jgi:hypothetical protein
MVNYYVGLYFRPLLITLQDHTGFNGLQRLDFGFDLFQGGYHNGFIFKPLSSCGESLEGKLHAVLYFWA